ncbi:MAG: glycosyltransferase, partial [Clostridiales bacterium]|nr:glycosyltransferase [Clostridiales bacterium]
MSTTDADSEQKNHPSEFIHALPACDILMQLNNMLEGGMENVVIDLAHSLEGLGYNVAILVLGDTGEGARKALRGGLRVCAFLYDEQALQRELERVRPVMVFAHYSFQGAHLYERLGIPFIQVLHSVYIWFDDAGKAMFARATAHTTLFVAISETVKEYSVEQLGVPEEKCQTIPNGVDLSKFTPNAAQEARELRGRLGYSEEDFIFIAVASLDRIKRILALIKSFRCIRDLAPHARLVLLGYSYDKGYQDEILAYIDQSGLQDHVSYAGYSTTPELYYLMADAFVHASAVEGGQLVLLEALAANLAVVTTDVGFARHFASYPGVRVIDRDFSYTHTPFTAEALRPSSGLVADLAWAMLQTYRNGTKPNLPQQVITAFDAKQTYARYEQLIAGIMKRPPKTEPTVGWVDLLPEAPASSGAPLPSDGKDTIADVVRAIADYEATVSERDAQLAERNAQLAERNAQLAERDAQLAEHNVQLAERNAQLAER